MTIKVIVFDFDGTLVDSNRLKYDAWFQLFPNDAHHAGTVKAVLARMGEASRYDIIEAILKDLDRQSSVMQSDIDALAERYNDIVLDAAKHCAEVPGAGQALKSLVGDYRLYVSSTTPETPLKEIIHFRGWTSYFAGIFGYPCKKRETLGRILEKDGVDAKAVLVVGDGESDRNSARKNGCLFLHVDAAFDYDNFKNRLATHQRIEVSS
jgi:phosphoglycolate phosphatase-like HAD superfamily hydrolase